MLFPEGRLGGQGHTQNAVRAGSSCSASEKQRGDGDQAEGDGGQGGDEQGAAGPEGGDQGAPRAMPIGAARMSSELRAARTWASAPGGLASWNTPMDSDITQGS
jgi:hypothetical protein